MLMMRTSGGDAMATLTAAVAAHGAGGEVNTRLQSDWSDVVDLPTIVVRMGNCMTIKQGGTFREAAEGLLGWVSSHAGPA